MAQSKNILKQILQEEIVNHNSETESKAKRYEELKAVIRESILNSETDGEPEIADDLQNEESKIN